MKNCNTYIHEIEMIEKNVSIKSNQIQALFASIEKDWHLKW